MRLGRRSRISPGRTFQRTHEFDSDLEGWTHSFNIVSSANSWSESRGLNEGRGNPAPSAESEVHAPAQGTSGNVLRNDLIEADVLWDLKITPERFPGLFYGAKVTEVSVQTDSFCDQNISGSVTQNGLFASAVVGGQAATEQTVYPVKDVGHSWRTEDEISFQFTDTFLEDGDLVRYRKRIKAQSPVAVSSNRFTQLYLDNIIVTVVADGRVLRRRFGG